jgi:uncharacterized protein (DUF58 family)
VRVDHHSLNRFAALRLRAPGPATSLHQGDRRSPFLGRGVEFADYRPYDPADDVRLIDWNVYMRLGQALVRQFNEERSLTIEVCLDVSASMGFGTPRKADHGAEIAAALAVVSLAHRDPMKMCCVGSDRPPALARAVNLDGMAEILHVLAKVEPWGHGDLYAQLASQLGSARPDRLVLISDLLCPDGEREALLKLLAASSRHPLILHVLSPEELAPDLTDIARVVDAETGESLVLRDDRQARADYDVALQRWLGCIESRCRTLGIGYQRADTSGSVSTLIHGALRQAKVVEHATGGHS